MLRNGNVLPASSIASSHYRIENEGSVLQIPASQVEMAWRRSSMLTPEQRRRQRVGTRTDAHLNSPAGACDMVCRAEASEILMPAPTILATLARTPDYLARLRADEASRQQRELEGLLWATPSRQRAEEIAQPKERMIDPKPEVQEKFVRSIQPMLIHGRITTPAAIRPTRVKRWNSTGGSRGVSGIPTLIRKNLEQVLGKVDVEDPASSPQAYAGDVLASRMVPAARACRPRWRFLPNGDFDGMAQRGRRIAPSPATNTPALGQNAVQILPRRQRKPRAKSPRQWLTKRARTSQSRQASQDGVHAARSIRP